MSRPVTKRNASAVALSLLSFEMLSTPPVSPVEPDTESSGSSGSINLLTW